MSRWGIEPYGTDEARDWIRHLIDDRHRAGTFRKRWRSGIRSRYPQRRHAAAWVIVQLGYPAVWPAGGNHLLDDIDQAMAVVDKLTRAPETLFTVPAAVPAQERDAMRHELQQIWDTLRARPGEIDRIVAGWMP